MDFVVSLPQSTRGYDAIFSIIDRFSRTCRFIPCHTTLSALDAANLFFEHWVCRFGVPKKIVSDRDVKFTSQFWQQLFALLGCKVALSTSYHPQTDGLTERFHRTIE
jgi:transposase InsO family protein